MKKLKLVGWTHFECEYPTPKVDKDEMMVYVELIKKELKKKRYFFSGEGHQNSLTGVPVFSDGTCFRASMRAWGLMMARAHTDEHNQYTYMDFYMANGGFTRFPKIKKIKVEPAVVENISFGCTLESDRQIIAESKAYGLTFMTTDKVLKKLAEED
jgi:hypothetical protein